MASIFEKSALGQFRQTGRFAGGFQKPDFVRSGSRAKLDVVKSLFDRLMAFRIGWLKQQCCRAVVPI
jgi:hypothetical protein